MTNLSLVRFHSILVTLAAISCSSMSTNEYTLAPNIVLCCSGVAFERAIGKYGTKSMPPAAPCKGTSWMLQPGITTNVVLQGAGKEIGNVTVLGIIADYKPC